MKKYWMFIGLIIILNVGVVRGEIISNGNINLAVNDYGQYTEATGDGKLLLYGYPTPWSSYTTIRIDRNDYPLTNSSAMYLVNRTVSNNHVYFVWKFPHNITVISNLSLIQNYTKYEYIIINNDNETHEVGVRLMFDTMLANNDGAPFRIPGYGDLTVEKEFINPLFNYWICTDSLSNPTLTSICYFDIYNKPNKVQFAYWSDIYRVLFDYNITENRNITMDTAVGMYWYYNITPSNYKVVTVYYGTSKPVIGSKRVKIVSLMTDKEVYNYSSDRNVNIYVDVGNGGKVTFNETLVVDIIGSDGNVVYKENKSILVEPNAIKSYNFTYNILPTLNSGRYYINAYLYNETSLIDNESLTFDIIIPKHDVKISYLSYPSIATENDTIPITLTIKNIGNFKENVTILLMKNNEIIGNKTIIINPEESEIVSFNYTLPSYGTIPFKVVAVIKNDSNLADNTIEFTIYVHKLIRYGTISGKLLDNSGNAINGVVILSGGEIYRITDAKDGLFTFMEIPYGNYTIYASSDNYTTNSTTITLNKTVIFVNISLNKLNVIKGYVIDELSNDVIKNAKVKLMSGSVVKTVYTDEYGRYQFNSLDRGIYYIEVEKNGYNSKKVEVILNSTGIEVLKNISLMPKPSLKITVKDVNGNYLPNTSIILSSDIAYNSITDENGSAIFENVIAGNYTLRILKEGFEEKILYISLPYGEKKSINITLNKLPIIYGIIKDEYNNAISNATLLICDGYYTYRALTNDSGGYYLVLPKGNYTIIAGKLGYLSNQTNVILDYDKIYNLNITLTKLCIIKGYVLDAVDNSLINNTIILLYKNSTLIDFADVENGSYTIKYVKFGNYTIKINKIGYVPYKKKIEVNSLEFIYNISLTPTANISGFIRDIQTNNPLVGEVCLLSNNSIYSVKSNVSGYYKLSYIPPGNYTLKVSADKHQLYEQKIVLNPKDDLKVNVSLKPSDLYLNVSILHYNISIGENETIVIVPYNNNNGYVSLSSLNITLTNGNVSIPISWKHINNSYVANFEIPNVSVGKYLVEIYAVDIYGNNISKLESINIYEPYFVYGVLSNNIIEKSKNSYAVVYVSRYSNLSKPISGLNISLSVGNYKITSYDYINGTYVFNITNIPPGNYKVDVLIDNFKYNIGELSVIDDILISLQTKDVYANTDNITISGFVKYENGTPIKNNRVVLELIANDYTRTFSIITDDTGKYSLTFKPLSTEGGKFKIKVSTTVNGITKTNISEFEIINFYADDSISLAFTKNTNKTVSLSIGNTGDSPIENLKATFVGLANGINATLNLPDRLKGKELIEVNLTVITSLNAPDEDDFIINITGNSQGVVVYKTIKCHVKLYPAYPIVRLSTDKINMSVKQNTSNVIDITVFNDGYSPLKDVHIKSPKLSWMMLSTDDLGDINFKSAKSFSILVSPNSEVPYGKYEDEIVIYSSNCQPIKIPIYIEVSPSNYGSVRFNVMNDFGDTVPDAVIKLSYSSGNITFYNITNASGVCIIKNIPIGKYSYFIDSDDGTVFGNVTIEPNRTVVINETIYVSPIDYEFGSEPTKIDNDTYFITLNLTFETDVPPPYLIVGMYASSHSYDLGWFNHYIKIYEDRYIAHNGTKIQAWITIHNLGLIAVKNITVDTTRYNSDIEFIFPTNFNRSWVKIDELGALNSTRIPVIIKIRKGCDVNNWKEHIGDVSIVGNYIHFNRITKQPMVSKTGTQKIAVYVKLTTGQLVVNPRFICKIEGKPIFKVNAVKMINERIENKINNVFKIKVNLPDEENSDLLGYVTIYNPTNEPYYISRSNFGLGGKINIDILDTINAIISYLIGAPTGLPKMEGEGLVFHGNIVNTTGSAIDYGMGDMVIITLDKTTGKVNILPDYDTIGIHGAKIIEIKKSAVSLNNIISILRMIYNINLFMEYLNNTYNITLNKGDSVTMSVEQVLFDLPVINDILDKTCNHVEIPIVDDYVNREVSTGGGITGFLYRRELDTIPNYYSIPIFEMEYPDIFSIFSIILSNYNYTGNYTYTTYTTYGRSISIPVMLPPEYEEGDGYGDFIYEYYGGTSRNVEVKTTTLNTLHEIVKLKILQNATMEREALDVSLSIRNKLARYNISNLNVTLKIYNASEDDVTDKFFIKVRTFNINNNTIKPLSVGRYYWMVIPSAGMGGKCGKTYYIRAYINYNIKTKNYSINTSSLSFVVNPQPLLKLDYMIQRHVHANVPFYLAVRVENIGNGTAKNFAIKSAQPQIYENLAGLLVHFKIVGCAINGKPESPTLNLNFGDIKPGEHKIGYWKMISSLNGEFTEFKASCVHTDEYGGEKTSLIKEINTKIINRDIKQNNMEKYFTLDIDNDNIPDEIVDLSTGASSKIINKSYTILYEDGECIKIKTTKEAGKWIRIEVYDPERYNREVVRIKRGDGTIVNPDQYYTIGNTLYILDDPDAEYIIEFGEPINTTFEIQPEAICLTNATSNITLLFRYLGNIDDELYASVDNISSYMVFIDNLPIGTNKTFIKTLDSNNSNGEVLKLSIKNISAINESSTIIHITFNTKFYNKTITLTIINYKNSTILDENLLNETEKEIVTSLMNNTNLTNDTIILGSAIKELMDKLSDNSTEPIVIGLDKSLTPTINNIDKKEDDKYLNISFDMYYGTKGKVIVGIPIVEGNLNYINVDNFTEVKIDSKKLIIITLENPGYILISIKKPEIAPKIINQPLTNPNSGHSESKHYSRVSNDIKSLEIKRIVSLSKLVLGSDIDAELSAKELKDTYDLINKPLEITEDTILIGGPIANPLTKKYIDKFPVKINNTYPGKHKGVIQVITLRVKVDKNIYRDVTVILLAGSDRWGTKAAVEYFKQLEDIPEEPIFVEWRDGKVVKIKP